MPGSRNQDKGDHVLAQEQSRTRYTHTTTKNGIVNVLGAKYFKINLVRLNWSNII